MTSVGGVRHSVRMAGDPDVVKVLNEQLTSELAAINQYFLH